MLNQPKYREELTIAEDVVTTLPAPTVLELMHEKSPTSNNTSSLPVTSPGGGKVRVNGFEGHPSKDQAISTIGHTVSAILFYVSTIILLTKGSMSYDQYTKTNSKFDSSMISPLRNMLQMTWIALFAHIICVLLLLYAWYSCEKIDPSIEMNKSLPKGWLGIKLKGPRWEKTRYCAVCRKNVPGLDHHCSWLQTCVGQSNYAQFFTIAVCGAIQFSIQLIFCSICIIWVQLPFEETETIRSIVIVLLAVCVLISVPCTIMYFVLLCFHISLYFHGYGTYEWMLRRRRKKRAAAAAMAAPSAKETPPKTDSLSIANIQTVGQVTSI